LWRLLLGIVEYVVNEEQKGRTKGERLLFRVAYGRKMDKILETDATWACHSGEPIAR